MGSSELPWALTIASRPRLGQGRNVGTAPRSAQVVGLEVELGDGLGLQRAAQVVAGAVQALQRHRHRAAVARPGGAHEVVEVRPAVQGLDREPLGPAADHPVAAHGGAAGPGVEGSVHQHLVDEDLLVAGLRPAAPLEVAVMEARGEAAQRPGVRGGEAHQVEGLGVEGPEPRLAGERVAQRGIGRRVGEVEAQQHLVVVRGVEHWQVRRIQALAPTEHGHAVAAHGGVLGGREQRQQRGNGDAAAPHARASTSSLPRWSPVNRLCSAPGSCSKPRTTVSSNTSSPRCTIGPTTRSSSSMRCR
mmetsp:Transcript_57690/g.135902  ORF Transcript_57690/g.135902 Transcript_57690/m.135902 type:complete len:303 (-) Transcript_57690:430-1338(-)